jgi:hypothetical protein
MNVFCKRVILMVHHFVLAAFLHFGLLLLEVVMVQTRVSGLIPAQSSTITRTAGPSQFPFFWMPLGSGFMFGHISSRRKMNAWNGK